MQNDEWNTTDEINAVRLGTDGLRRLDGIVGVDPLDERAEEATHSEEVITVSDETSRTGKLSTILSASRVSRKNRDLESRDGKITVAQQLTRSGGDLFARRYFLVLGDYLLGPQRWARARRHGRTGGLSLGCDEE